MASQRITFMQQRQLEPAREGVHNASDDKQVMRCGHVTDVNGKSFGDADGWGHDLHQCI